MYNLPGLQFVLQPGLMLLASGLVIGVTMLAAFAAVYKELMEVPSQLMRPKAPKIGKKILLERVPMLWSRFSFTWKVTARNIFRYKKRFFMTVIGIAGCSALLVAGFGIQDSISDIVTKQYEEIFNYRRRRHVRYGRDRCREGRRPAASARQRRGRRSHRRRPERRHGQR